ncbi:hypothetical protein LTY36_04995 [Limosilactobacillus agrestis]|uniref:Phage protein n=1 Tax=Limosilactobacillus agrestis TaxID=2759748 RepID=A0ABS8R6Y4_9LACO|nr:hypothetical protein [Limosilactobacillus agrestis]MCD7130547.1 hypothetical protein [Limosilactobacillus agrestis]
MNNSVDMNQVAQKLINKLAVQEYNNSILETQVDQLRQENQQLKQEIENNKKEGK